MDSVFRIPERPIRCTQAQLMNEKKETGRGGSIREPVLVCCRGHCRLCNDASEGNS
jgi:hypothetical protein